MKVSILIPNIFNHPFTYQNKSKKLVKGDFVKVPFGPSLVTGVVWDYFEETNKNFTPAVRIQFLGESSIDMMAYFRCNKYGDHHTIIHQFIKKLHQRFDEENIEIPFPIRTVIQRIEHNE